MKLFIRKLLKLSRNPLFKQMVKRAIIALLEDWAQYSDNNLTATKVGKTKDDLDGIVRKPRKK